MSHYTLQQSQALLDVLGKIVTDNKEPALVAMVQDNKLIEAARKDAFVEMTIEDVAMVAENTGVDLTDDEIRTIAYDVISNYDENHYKQYIDTRIAHYKQANP